MNFTVVGVLVSVLMVAAFSAYAGGPKDKATGEVTWTARTSWPEGQQIPGIVSSFNAHDVDPDGSDGDKGTHTLYRPADTNYGFPGGSLTMDIQCVNVNGDQAWFAGVVTDADGGYSDTVGNAFLYWVFDGSTSGAEADKIGGRGYGSIQQACAEVEAGNWTGSGDVTDGNLMTHYWD